MIRAIRDDEAGGALFARRRHGELTPYLPARTGARFLLVLGFKIEMLSTCLSPYTFWDYLHVSFQTLGQVI